MPPFHHAAIEAAKAAHWLSRRVEMLCANLGANRTASSAADLRLGADEAAALAARLRELADVAEAKDRADAA